MTNKVENISIPGLIIKYCNAPDKEKLGLFMSVLDLHFGKEKVDGEMKKFETFIEKQRTQLKVVNEQIPKL